MKKWIHLALVDGVWEPVRAGPGGKVTTYISREAAQQQLDTIWPPEWIELLRTQCQDPTYTVKVEAMEVNE